MLNEIIHLLPKSQETFREVHEGVTAIVFVLEDGVGGVTIIPEFMEDETQRNQVFAAEELCKI